MSPMSGFGILSDCVRIMSDPARGLPPGSVTDPPVPGKLILIVCRTIGELAGLPVGTRIVTNHNKVLELDEVVGGRYWIEPGTLQPFYSALVEWLPVIVLPPVKNPHEDEA